MSASLWEIPNISNVKTPLSVMKEQGHILAAQTNWLLIGHASAAGGITNISNEFRIVVPSLNNYTYTLCVYDQMPNAIFPGSLSSPLMKESIRIENIGHFEIEFGEIIRSNPAIDLLRSLLAQASAMSS